MSGEDDLIARHFAPLAGPGALGLRDDAALIAVPAGHELVVTVDAVVAGVHFFPDDPPEDVARKALRVNLSDLAAKGATPTGFLLTLALPPGFAGDYVDRFAAALGEDARIYGCPLLGGDTVRTPGPLTISITAFGTVPTGAMVRRDGTGEGDMLFVSGTVGDAALGLLVARGDARVAALAAGHAAFLLDRYRRPQPRNALAPVLRQYASAAMDVSDGLAGDLAKMLGLVDLAANVRLQDLPLSRAARAAVMADPKLWETVLAGGDDYEVLCAVPSSRASAFTMAAQDIGLEMMRVGAAEKGKGVCILDGNGRTLSLDRLSFSHL